MTKTVVLSALLLLTVITICACSDSNSDYTDYSTDSYSSQDKYDTYDDYGSGYGYDENDPYYSENDHNHDGKINDQEFQDAMGDLLDDLSEYY